MSVRYQQKPATMGQNLAAAAQGFAMGQMAGEGVVGLARRGQAPAHAAGRLARERAPFARPDLPGPRTAAFYGNRYGFDVPAGQGTAEQEALLRAQRHAGARIRENRDRVRLGRFRDMDPPTAEGLPRRGDPLFPGVMGNITAFASSPEFARRAAALV